MKRGRKKRKKKEEEYCSDLSSVFVMTSEYKKHKLLSQRFKTFLSSNQLSIKFMLLINVKMPTKITIVVLLTFICRINGWLW